MKNKKKLESDSVINNWILDNQVTGRHGSFCHLYIPYRFYHTTIVTRVHCIKNYLLEASVSSSFNFSIHLSQKVHTI